MKCFVSRHKIHIMVSFNFSLSIENKIDKEKYGYGRFMNISGEEIKKLKNMKLLKNERISVSVYLFVCIGKGNNEYNLQYL